MANGTQITVDSATGEYFTKAATDDSKAINDSTTPEDESDPLTVNGNLIVYAATEVTLNNVDATYDRSGVPQTVRTGYHVAMGTDLTVAPVANQGTGVIVGTTFGDDLDGTYEVGKDDVTLSAAVELTLNEGVSAVLEGTTTNVASGKYVKAGESNLLTITVNSDYGTAAIDLAQAGGLKHVETGAIVSGGDLTSTGTEDIDLYAAAKVTWNSPVNTLYYEGSRNPIDVASASYILSGVTLYTDGNTVTEDDGGESVQVTPDEGEYSFITSNVDVTVSNT